jgi:K+/H+ antiporter YhaU regulatory subunit KhtT
VLGCVMNSPPEAGIRIGIIADRRGEFEFVTYPRDDPDQCQPLLRLTATEAGGHRRRNPGRSSYR